TAPGCCVLGKIADSLYSVLQVSAIEPRQVPARHADCVEDVLVSPCEDLEQDQILWRRERNEATEQSFLDGAAVCRLLEWKRGEARRMSSWNGPWRNRRVPVAWRRSCSISGRTSKPAATALAMSASASAGDAKPTTSTSPVVLASPTTPTASPPMTR